MKNAMLGLECGWKLCLALFTINLSGGGVLGGNGNGGGGNHHGGGGGSSSSQSQWENLYSHPYFDNSTKRDVTITVGQTANLPCKVRNLGDRAVSWIRKHDLHIITIGIMTYTNDQRFQAVHPEGSDEWILKISSGQPRDSGIYECQVSTEPKISLPYRLTVVVAKAKILANNELFFKSGSDINLTCVSLQATHPPSYIYWYKDGYLINYSQRGGINVLTERQTRTSTLVISRAVPPDSGNYTCFPSNTNSDSVLVHVIKSEHRAAMQHENNGASGLMSTSSLTGWWWWRHWWRWSSSSSSLPPSRSRTYTMQLWLIQLLIIGSTFHSIWLSVIVTDIQRGGGGGNSRSSSDGSGSYIWNGLVKQFVGWFIVICCWYSYWSIYTTTTMPTMTNAQTTAITTTTTTTATAASISWSSWWSWLVVLVWEGYWYYSIVILGCLYFICR